jgi:hypothetical protein
MIAPNEGALADKPKPAPRSPWRQVIVITLVALALYVVARLLPTGTNLSHMDFRAGGSSVEFCDPANPQFMPVVAVRSPVEMTLECEGVVAAGREVRAVATLKTATGKLIRPEDLLVAHTQKLHLLVIDPTLTDYQHLHPQPGRKAGEWEFAFTPRRSGVYRIFADFTPAATARGLYARADLSVAATQDEPTGVVSTATNRTYEENGYTFELRPDAGVLKSRRVMNLTFRIGRRDGGAVALQPVMGALAHLVAFDEARSGFAHLHPNETDKFHSLDTRWPRLTFKLTIPRAGRYVIWSQVILDGREVFAPFWFEVVE